MLLRTDALPDCGGLVATLLVTMTAEQLDTGQGYATTSHGDLVPVRRIVETAIDSQTMSVLLDSHGGILDYGRTRRLAPPGLRLALYARDQGCTFPDCDRPPQWSPSLPRMAGSRRNIHRQHGPRLRLPPQNLHPKRLAQRHDQRRTPLDTTRAHRPEPATPTQPPTPPHARRPCPNGLTTRPGGAMPSFGSTAPVTSKT
jgi:hypothetical protein